MISSLRYAKEFYALMDKAATDEALDGTTPVRVFRGKLTELFKQLQASSKYYSQIRSILVLSGSVTIVEAGARNKLSTVVLNFPPSDDAARHLTSGPTSAKLVVEMERRVLALEAWRETQGGINIAEAIRNMEQRLVKLENLTKTGRK